MSLKLHEKFDGWVQDWNKVNVTSDMAQVCSDWLMGENEDIKPCVTTRRTIDNDTASPYYPYSKYKVKILKETDSETAE